MSMCIPKGVGVLLLRFLCTRDAISLRILNWVYSKVCPARVILPSPGIPSVSPIYLAIAIAWQEPAKHQCASVTNHVPRRTHTHRSSMSRPTYYYNKTRVMPERDGPSLSTWSNTRISLDKRGPDIPLGGVRHGSDTRRGMIDHTNAQS